MPDARSPTGESVISVDNVVKEFGPLRVLDGVSLDVTRGQTVAIVGRSRLGQEHAACAASPGWRRCRTA